MITDYHMLSGLHKVAILFSVVGESLSLSLVKGLSKTEIRKIRSTMREMDRRKQKETIKMEKKMA